MIIFSRYYCHVLLLLNLLSVFSCVNHFNLWWYNNYLEFLIKQTVHIMNTAGENQSRYDSLHSDHDNIDCDMILDALQYLHLFYLFYIMNRHRKRKDKKSGVISVCGYYAYYFILIMFTFTQLGFWLAFRLVSLVFLFSSLQLTTLLATLISQTGTGTICLRSLHIWIKWLIFHICVSIITSKPCNTLWH